MTETSGSGMMSERAIISVRNLVKHFPSRQESCAARSV